MTMPAEPWTLPSWAGDLSEIVAASLSLLRIDSADVDATRLESYAGAAVRRIDAYLDPSPGDEQPDPPPPELFDAAVTVTVRLYKGKDAPFGVVGGWSESDMGPIPVPSDPLQGVYSLIRPLKSQFGIG